MIKCTHSPTTYSNVSSLPHLTTCRARDKTMDFMQVPICNHRCGVLGNDVTIYYPGFQTFVDSCKSINPEKEDYIFINDLCLSMSKSYDCESFRLAEFRHLLTRYLGDQLTIEKVTFSSGSTCDQCIFPNAIALIEGKNEICSTGNDSGRECCA